MEILASLVLLGGGCFLAYLALDAVRQAKD